MSDKETVLNLIHNLPDEVSLGEILQGIESIAAARQNTFPNSQINALRTSAEAAVILTQALAANQSHKNASEN
jgi:hypothetical protein